jgi:hypothetical protein
VKGDLGGNREEKRKEKLTWLFTSIVETPLSTPEATNWPITQLPTLKSISSPIKTREIKRKKEFTKD